MDGEYSTAEQGRTGLALQDNVGHSRTCKCKPGVTYVAVSQKD